MSSQNNLPVLPALCPAISDVPSRRHLVVIRRGEEHHKDLVSFLKELGEGVRKNGESAVTACSLGLVKNELELIDRAVDELDHYTSAEAKVEIEDRLKALKEAREEARRVLKLSE